MIKPIFTCDVCKSIGPLVGYRFTYDFAKLIVNEGKAQIGFKPVSGTVEVCSIECGVKFLRKVTKELFEPPLKKKVGDVKQNGKGTESKNNP